MDQTQTPPPTPPAGPPPPVHIPGTSKKFHLSKVVVMRGILILIILVVLAGLALLFLSQNKKQSASVNTSYPFAISVNGDQVSVNDYINEYNYINSFYNNKDQSIQRTNDLFTTNLLLKQAYTQSGKTLSDSDLTQYATQSGDPKAILQGGSKLEAENDFLQNQLFQQNVSWYTGDFILVRFLSSSPKSQADAQTMINQIKNDWTKNPSYEALTTKYRQNTQFMELNDNQGFGGSFTEMSLDNPTVSSPEFAQTLKTLQPNQISPVITLTTVSPPATKAGIPYAYALIKLTQKGGGTNASFSDWISNQKATANIVINPVIN